MQNLSLTQKRLRELLHYDPETGLFTWRHSRGQAQAGDIAGAIHHKGYRRIGLEGGNYAAHRLAWLYVHGVWPTETIDHINGVRHDNRIANLRDVSAAANSHYATLRSSVNSTGFRGVYRNGPGWGATIRIAGKSVHLGQFDSPEQAHRKYMESKRAHHRGLPE